MVIITRIVTLWNNWKIQAGPLVPVHQVIYLCCNPLHLDDLGSKSCIIRVWNSPISFQSISPRKSMTWFKRFSRLLTQWILKSTTTSKPSTVFGIRSQTPITKSFHPILKSCLISHILTDSKILQSLSMKKSSLLTSETLIGQMKNWSMLSLANVLKSSTMT